MADSSSPKIIDGPSPVLGGAVAAVVRRRGRALECAIVSAVLDLLREGGYEAVTMEAVAARARTGKAALYRRWGSRADLVVHVIERSLPPADAPPDTGSVRSDLLEMLRRMATLVNSPAGCVLCTMTSPRDMDPAFRDLVTARVVEPQLQAMCSVFRRGIDRGEVRPGVPVELIAEVGPALLLKRVLADGESVTDQYVELVVDELLMPILR